MATGEACSSLQDKFPGKTIMPYCRPFLEDVWNNTKSKCQEGGLNPFPTGMELVHSVCNVASQKEIKAQVVDDLCAFIKHTFPQSSMNEYCHIMADRAWDEMLDKCPTGSLKALPTPRDVEAQEQTKLVRAVPGKITGLFCGLARMMNEDMATGEACSSLQDKFPGKTIMPYCRSFLEDVWNNTKSKCQEGGLNPFPTGMELVHSVCNVASQKEIKEQVVDDLCTFIKHTFPENSMNE